MSLPPSVAERQRNNAAVAAEIIAVAVDRNIYLFRLVIRSANLYIYRIGNGSNNHPAPRYGGCGNETQFPYYIKIKPVRFAV